MMFTVSKSAPVRTSNLVESSDLKNTKKGVFHA